MAKLLPLLVAATFVDVDVLVVAVVAAVAVVAGAVNIAAA